MRMLCSLGKESVGLIEEVWPKTCGQRCWAHKTANVVNKLPKPQRWPSDCLGSPHALTKLDAYRLD
jgi:hypothetical protein